jgi:hypothetical protein
MGSSHIVEEKMKKLILLLLLSATPTAAFAQLQTYKAADLSSAPTPPTTTVEEPPTVKLTQTELQGLIMAENAKAIANYVAAANKAVYDKITSTFMPSREPSREPPREPKKN